MSRWVAAAWVCVSLCVGCACAEAGVFYEPVVKGGGLSVVSQVLEVDCDEVDRRTLSCVGVGRYRLANGSVSKKWVLISSSDSMSRADVSVDGRAHDEETRVRLVRRQVIEVEVRRVVEIRVSRDPELKDLRRLSTQSSSRDSKRFGGLVHETWWSSPASFSAYRMHRDRVFEVRLRVPWGWRVLKHRRVDPEGPMNPSGCESGWRCRVEGEKLVAVRRFPEGGGRVDVALGRPDGRSVFTEGFMGVGGVLGRGLRLELGLDAGLARYVSGSVIADVLPSPFEADLVGVLELTTARGRQRWVGLGVGVPVRVYPGVDAALRLQGTLTWRWSLVVAADRSFETGGWRFSTSVRAGFR